MYFAVTSLKLFDVMLHLSKDLLSQEIWTSIDPLYSIIPKG